MIENDMNRYFKTLAMAVAVAGFLASCHSDDIVPDVPEQPSVSKYEQI